MCNMEKICLTASKEKSFEDVDGRTTDACKYYKLTYESLNKLPKQTVDVFIFFADTALVLFIPF